MHLFLDLHYKRVDEIHSYLHTNGWFCRMGRKEQIQKEIDLIEGKVRFFRNAILALVSALVWVIYAILEQKVGKEILILAGVGAVVLIVLFVRTKSLENKEYWLLEELRKEE